MSIRQVGLELRVEGEREATQALRRYVDASEKLKTSVLDAAGKLNSVNSRWQQANKLYDQGTLSAKALKAAQTQLARELAVLNGYMTKNGTANTNKALAELRAAEATRRNAQAQEEASRAAQAHAREVDQLAMKYKPLYAASKQYETALNELNRAHQIGALNSAQHRVEIDKLDAEYTQFLNGAARAGNRFSGHINQTSMRLNQMGVVTQQAGYQIGDFLVQVQSGTNPMVAFGQQATQLVGVMGMMNPKLIGLSAGLGIAIPLVTAIGAAFMRTKEEAKKAEEAFSGVGASLRDLESIRMDSIARDFADYARQASTEFRSILSVMEQVERRALAAKLREPLVAVAGEIASFENRSTLLARVGGTADFESDYGLRSRSEALFLAARLKELDGETREELQGQLEEITEAITLRGILTEEVSALLSKLGQELDITATINENVKSTSEAAAEFYERIKSVAEQQIDGAFYRAQTALDGVNSRLDQTISKISSIVGAVGSIGFSTIALEAETRALEAGKSAGLATIEGKVAQRRAEMSQAGPIGPIEMLGLSAYRSSLQREYEARLARDAALNAPGRTRPQGRPIDFAPSGGGRGGGSSRETATESQFLAALEAELAVKRKMIGASEQERAILERVNELQDQAIQKDLNISESRLRQFAEEELAIQRQLDMQATFSNNIERAMMAVVDGTASVEDAFKSMLRNIIMEIYQQQVAKPIASSIGGWISKLFGSANGNVFAGGGHVTAYANGGVVNGPTFFPMTGNKTGLMGEAGPEAIMPLTRTKNGKLGVVAEGGGGVVVNNHFNIAANGDTSVKQIVKGMMPQITAATKSAVVDAKRRGGNYGKAFN